MKWILTIILITLLSFISLESSRPKHLNAGVLDIKKEHVVHDTIFIDKEPEQGCDYTYACKYQEIADNYKILEDSIIKPIERHFRALTDKNFSIYISSDVRPHDRCSDHSHGCAIDIDMHMISYPVSNKDVYKFVKDSLNFDQLICYRSMWSPSHVHIGFRANENRKEVLLAKRTRRRTLFKMISKKK